MSSSMVIVRPFMLAFLVEDVVVDAGSPLEVAPPYHGCVVEVKGTLGEVREIRHG